MNRAFPLSQALLALMAQAVLVALVTQSCDSSSSEQSPTTPPAVERTPTPSPASTMIVPTLEPLSPVTLSERITFYGADAGDAATGLAAGDFNGDGIPDIALAAAFADGPDNARPDAGETYLFFGPFAAGESRDAALGQQDVSIYGAAEGDQLGRAAAAADINGDGLDDLILGAPFADGPSDQRPDAGDTLILIGATSWPAIIDLAEDPAAATGFGGDEEDLSGFSLVTGDFNGDGIDDLIIGAFWADGPGNSRPEAGESYVIFGSTSLPSTIDLADGDQNLVAYGADAGDRLTEALTAGDVNGDGVDDLILPATFGAGPRNLRPKAGEVYVVFGGDLAAVYDFARDRPDITILGADEGDQIGHSAAVADFDGNGLGDLLLGAVSADGPGNTRDLAGEAFLILAGISMPGAIDTLENAGVLRVHGADSVDRLGRSAAAGDLNGDGLSDVILAATGGDGPDGSTKDAGEVHIIFGRRALRGALGGALDLARQAVDLTIKGLDPDDVLGLNTFGRPSLLSADIDGDGLDDLLVSALGDGTANDREDAGEAYILFARR